ncbi:MAG: hypothetical protein H0X29_08425, partial [Parachlamydiaceae bacterium]|nr:hypothetical protein [Parachlamydiaceae bacterium]
RERLDDAVYSAISFPQAISKMVVDYLEEYPSFGESEWTALCERVDPAPPLPHDFSDIWNGPCPIYSGKKISETHMLVYIPATVDGKPFTLKKLGEIAKRFFPQNDSGYSHIWSGINDELGDKSIKSRWVLMTKDVLPGSRNKSYAEQQKTVDRLAKKSLVYKVPGTLEAATCILVQYFFDSKTRLFNDEPLTYTRCKEKVRGYQTVVGGFAPAGLDVFRSHSDYDSIGVAALRKF